MYTRRDFLKATSALTVGLNLTGTALVRTGRRDICLESPRRG